MGSSYQRQDVSNNIANGNIINADDLDAEFNALDAAFTATTGHTHDGTAGEGGPITMVGPAQDLTVSAVQVLPKTDNTLDLGSPSFEFKDLWIDGTANIDSLVADTADINAGTIDNTVIGGTTPAAGTFTAISGTSGVIEANSASTAFRITQTGTGEALRVEDSTNPDATPFIVSAAGDVGIGITPSNTTGYSTLAFDGTLGGNIEFYVNGTLSGEMYSSSTGILRLGTTGADSVILRTDGTDRLELDSLGNLALNGNISSFVGDTVFAINSNTQDAQLRLRYLNSTVAYFKSDQNVSASLFTDGSVPLRIGTNNTTRVRIGATTGNLSINRGNADGDARAAIDVGGTDKGVLLPRLNTTQRDALVTPPTGLLIYNTTNNRLEFFTGSAWAAVGAGTTTLSDLGVTATATELNVLDNVTTNGLVTRTAAGTGTARSIASGTGITVTNGDGVAGNPTVAVSGNLSSLAGLSLVQGDLLYATAADTLVRLPKGTAGQVLRMNTGATAPEWGTGGITLGSSQATTSGTAFDFTGIPSTARRVTVLFQGVSLSGTDDILVQIGTSGGVVSTGYTSGSVRPTWSANSTSGFVIAINTAAAAFSGQMIISNLTGNVWVAMVTGHLSGPTYFYGGGGDVTLGAVLDRVRITRTGTNTFDAGSVNVSWE